MPMTFIDWIPIVATQDDIIGLHSFCVYIGSLGHLFFMFLNLNLNLKMRCENDEKDDVYQWILEEETERTGRELQ